MKILNYGSLNIDLVYSVPNIVRPGETISSTEINMYPGGKGANQSVALAKAGAEVWHAGKIGSDGLWLLDKLKCNSVFTEFITQYHGRTGFAMIQVTEDGENSIILYGGGNKSITEREIDLTLSSFDKGDYIVLQNEINNLPYIINKAHSKGMNICLNPAPYSADILNLPLELVDILIVNETEGEGIAGIKGNFTEIIDQLTDNYPDTDIIMTAGEKGAYFGRNKDRLHTSIFKTKVVDTTAAGDTFLGFFLAGRISKMDIKDSMELASKASSIAVSRHGAMDSIPNLLELNL